MVRIGVLRAETDASKWLRTEKLLEVVLDAVGGSEVRGGGGRWGGPKGVGGRPQHLRQPHMERPWEKHPFGFFNIHGDRQPAGHDQLED